MLHKKHQPIVVDYEKILQESEKAFQEVDRMFTPINYIPLDCLVNIYNYGGFKVIDLLQKTNQEWHKKLSQLNNAGDSFVKRMYPIVAKFWGTRNRTNIIYRNLWFTDHDMAKKFDIKNCDYSKKSDLWVQYDHEAMLIQVTFAKIRQVGAICRDNNLLNKEPLSSLKVYLQIAVRCKDIDTIKIIAEILAKTDDYSESEDPPIKDRIFKANYEIHNRILKTAMDEDNEEIFRVIATIDPLHVKNRYYKYTQVWYEGYGCGPTYYTRYRTFFDDLEDLRVPKYISEEDKKKYHALYKECGGKTVNEIRELNQPLDSCK